MGAGSAGSGSGPPVVARGLGGSGGESGTLVTVRAEPAEGGGGSGHGGKGGHRGCGRAQQEGRAPVAICP